MSFGIAIIVVGIVFLLKNLGFIGVDVWTIIWPVLLIIIGLGLIFRRCGCCGWFGRRHTDKSGQSHGHYCEGEQKEVR